MRKLRDFPTAPGPPPAEFLPGRDFGGKRIGEMPTEWQHYALDCLDWYSERLRDVLDQTIEPVNRFLSFANAGGIALMIGLVPSFLENQLGVLPLMISAVCFVGGMLSLGLRVTMDAHINALIYSKLLLDKKKVRESILAPDEALAQYFQRHDRHRRFTRIPFRLAAFVFLVVGSLIAIGGVLVTIGKAA